MTTEKDSKIDKISNRSEAAKKAAETRKKQDPNAFSKMGQKGGSHSGGSKNK